MSWPEESEALDGFFDTKPCQGTVAATSTAKQLKTIISDVGSNRFIKCMIHADCFPMLILMITVGKRNYDPHFSDGQRGHSMVK